MNDLEKHFNHTFKNSDLLKRALTHRSIPGKNNERLEFLGDAVLSIIIASELYQRQPNAKEGELSRMRSNLVSGETLAQLAKDLNIHEYIRLGAGELKSGGQYRNSLLADALEAIIGAIYLDAGMDICHQCVMKWYGDYFDDLSSLQPQKDAKSTLQEWLQAHQLPLPDYQVTLSGAAHAQIFRVVCEVKGLPHSTEGISTSRRRAEQEAAQRFLQLLK